MDIEEKATYSVSANITNEQLAKRDTITDYDLATAAYLRDLNNAPSINDFPPHCYYRYKG